MSRFSRVLHYLFAASLLLKGGLAVTESALGLGLLLTPIAAIEHAVQWLAHSQLTEDPGDKLALASQHIFAAFSVESQHFYALYLIAHGSLKLFMVLTLARRLPWAYPTSMVLLAGFVAYQLHGFLQGGAVALGILAAFDAVMIALVWREYRLLGPKHPQRPQLERT